MKRFSSKSKKRSLLGIGSVENESRFRTGLELAYSSILESEKRKREYSISYNKVAENYSPQFAIVHLLELRNEFEKQILNANKSVDYLKEKIDELLNRDEEFDKKSIIQFLSTRLDGTDNSYLKELIKEYVQSIDEFIPTNYPSIIDNAKRAERDKKQFKLHHETLEELISHVLKNEYPQKLEIYSNEQLEEEAEKKTVGRKLDETAPQDEIASRVLEFIELAVTNDKSYSNFIHQSGKHKGKPNKNQLKEQLINEGLTGELDDRTIIRRIEKALEANDITILT